MDSVNKKQYATRAPDLRIWPVVQETAEHPTQAAIEARQLPAQVATNMLASQSPIDRRTKASDYQPTGSAEDSAGRIIRVRTKFHGGN